MDDEVIEANDHKLVVDDDDRENGGEGNRLWTTRWRLMGSYFLLAVSRRLGAELSTVHLLMAV